MEVLGSFVSVWTLALVAGITALALLGGLVYDAHRRRRRDGDEPQVRRQVAARSMQRLYRRFDDLDAVLQELRRDREGTGHWIHPEPPRSAVDRAPTSRVDPRTPADAAQRGRKLARGSSVAFGDDSMDLAPPLPPPPIAPAPTDAFAEPAEGSNASRPRRRRRPASRH